MKINNWILKNEKNINWFIFILSCVLILIGKYTHELWTDEWNPFGIAREAHNPIELYNLKMYEGHTYLYYFLLWLFTLITTKTKALIFYHYLFSVGAMYFLIIKGNFSSIIKLLFSLSIYYLYEYTIFNRMYVFCIFFIFLYTYLLKKKDISFFLSIVLFSINCQLDLFSAAIALFLGLYYFSNFNLSILKKTILICVAFINLVIAYIGVAQPKDSSFIPQNYFKLNIVDLIHYIRYFDFGFFTFHRWDFHQRNAIYVFNDWIIYFLFSIIIIGAFATIYNKKIKLFFLISILGISLINIQIHSMCLRHVGFYWVAYTIALWLDDNINKRKYLNYFLIPILLVQVFWGIRCYILDLEEPITTAPRASNYLKENVPNWTNYVGYGPFSAVTLAGYLKKPFINLRSGRKSFYIKYSKDEDLPNTPIDTIALNQFNTIYKNSGTYIFSVSAENPTRWMINLLDSITKTQPNSIKKMPEFLGSIYERENYYLYKIDNEIVW